MHDGLSNRWELAWTSSTETANDSKEAKGQQPIMRWVSGAFSGRLTDVAEAAVGLLVSVDVVEVGVVLGSEVVAQLRVGAGKGQLLRGREG